MGIINKFKENKKLMRFIETTQTRIQDSEMGVTSVVVAYYLLLSIFPLLIAVGNILPYLRIDPNTVLPYVKEIMPTQIYNFLGPAIQDLLTQESGGLLSISAIATLWSASQSINALQTAMNKAYGVEQRGNFIVVRLLSLGVIVLFMIAIVGVVGILGLGHMVLAFLQPIFDFPTQIIDTFETLKWPVVSLALFFIMLLIFLIVPNAKVKIRSVVPGAIFATVGWMLLAQVFGIYAHFFASKVSGYQIIGSFIVLMLWLNFSATILILGGIINAVVQEYLSGAEIEERQSVVSLALKKIKAIFKLKK
ncbi:ribonuclease BN [Enterococcus sp. JM4C]|uniref:YihY/virulence factor BrkB family protein n=1 Tax=Candidatus Enterococcus huntleyi TaxID=1857217 RepID=UPI001379FAEE|nr:YihY/virulence factor BrkB family protein [Enterococcus sp. JM4C]KAF1297228.1 ribonuclease BN [Enterococcus sp. JM4C]